MNAVIIDVFEVDNCTDSFSGYDAEADTQKEDPEKYIAGNIRKIHFLLLFYE
jgi:hypothetical protein